MYRFIYNMYIHIYHIRIPIYQIHILIRSNHLGERTLNYQIGNTEFYLEKY